MIVGNLFAHHGVAHPHRRQRILAAEREVLGHTFDEPERQRVEAHQSAAGRAFGDVVLEHVHELVAEHVIVVGVDAGERHDDARAVRLGDAARAFLELLADDVRLLEVRMVGVEDERLAVERVPEGVRVARVPALRHARRVVDDQRLGRIEEVVEVIRLEDFPGEGLVLDLVAAEVLLGLGWSGRKERRERHDGRRPAHAKSGHVRSPRNDPQQRVFPKSKRVVHSGFLPSHGGARDVPHQTPPNFAENGASPNASSSRVLPLPNYQYHRRTMRSPIPSRCRRGRLGLRSSGPAVILAISL